MMVRFASAIEAARDNLPVPLPPLPQRQLIAINLRLLHRIFVRGAKDRVGSVGLRVHTEAPHICDRSPGLEVRIDYHGEGGSKSHPEDYLLGCPARYQDPLLQSAISHAIQIEDWGGLSAWCGRPPALLPARVVEFYGAVLGARDRLVAERDSLRERLCRG